LSQNSTSNEHRRNSVDLPNVSKREQELIEDLVKKASGDCFSKIMDNGQLADFMTGNKVDPMGFASVVVLQMVGTIFSFHKSRDEHDQAKLLWEELQRIATR